MSSVICILLDILPQLRQELVFKNKFSTLALTMFEQIRVREGAKELVFVGIHARRGDRIHVWKQRLVRNIYINKIWTSLELLLGLFPYY